LRDGQQVMFFNKFDRLQRAPEANRPRSPVLATP
jgi:hypothetical protein